MKQFMEALEEQEKQERKQQKLRDKHAIEDENVIVVEKNNMIKFSIRSIATLTRLIATGILLCLATIGLMSLVYPETRNQLIVIAKQIMNQLKILI